jgi:hypothetical protein
MQEKINSRGTNPGVDIIKFQQIFKDLNHKDIAERLVSIIVTSGIIRNAMLITCRGANFNIDAIANWKEHAPVISINTPLMEMDFLPHSTIREAFETSEACLLNHDDVVRHGVHFSDKEINSCYILPILEKHKTLAVFYMESQVEIALLIGNTMDCQPGVNKAIY